MSNERTGESLEILITKTEWREIADWMHTSLAKDENSPNGHFLLELEGTSRTWVTSDGVQTTVLRTDGPAPRGVNDTGERCSVLVNSRFFRRNGVHDSVLTVESAGDHRVQRLETDGVMMTLPEHPGEFGDWRALVAAANGHTIDIATGDLVSAREVASLAPFGVSPADSVHMWMWVDDGQLRLRTPWIEYPATEISLPLDNSVEDTVPTLVEAQRFLSLLSPISDERCSLRLPRVDPMGLIRLSASDYEAVLQPTDRWGDVRERLESLLQDFLSIDSIEMDGDGDYPVSTPEGRQLYVRLVTTTQPVAVQVFSVLAHPVVGSPGLFEELNSINASATHVKVLWAAEAVMAEVDLVAPTVDMEELRNALEVVRTTADQYYDVLNAFFGSAPEHGSAEN